MNILQKIKENTSGMTGRERAEYVLTYYWYHMLGIAAAIGIVVFSVVHFVFPEQPPAFLCALVNQRIDYERDEKLEDAFARAADLEAESVIIDSDYHISYPGYHLEDANESYFDKLFFKWSGGELDAVVMSEDFLRYCVSVGGEFYSAEELEQEKTDTETEWQDVNGVSAVSVSETILQDYLKNSSEELEKENLLLVFPKEGINHAECRKFLNFICG